ncbi:MAG: hypothetical protein ACM3VS_06760, partial [Candidatus Dadabacteria bacterium]
FLEFKSWIAKVGEYINPPWGDVQARNTDFFYIIDINRRGNLGDEAIKNKNILLLLMKRRIGVYNCDLP